MGHQHGHGHTHGSARTEGDRRRLIIVLGITGSVFVAQVVGGLLSGSLALLADAGHMLSDTTGLAIALGAATLALRPPSKRRTFGWQRAEVLGACANAVLLTVVAIGIVVSALRRWSDPPEVSVGLMLAVAVLGAAANATGLLVLSRGDTDSLNLRGAYLEVLGDLLGSIAVITAGVVIAVTGWGRADTVASLVIACLILPRAWWLLRDVVKVLMESAPDQVDLDDVRRHMEELPEVVAVHDLHAWTITSGMPVLSAHVVVADECVAGGHIGRVLDRLGECLGGHFEVEHCTFQIEPVGHRDHEPAHHH